jgi:hypothetical protein
MQNAYFGIPCGFSDFWNGMGRAPTGQGLLSVTVLIVREKSLVGHSKMELFPEVIQL